MAGRQGPPRRNPLGGEDSGRIEDFIAFRDHVASLMEFTVPGDVRWEFTQPSRGERCTGGTGGPAVSFTRIGICRKVTAAILAPPPGESESPAGQLADARLPQPNDECDGRGSPWMIGASARKALSTGFLWRSQAQRSVRMHGQSAFQAPTRWDYGTFGRCGRQSAPPGVSLQEFGFCPRAGCDRHRPGSCSLSSRVRPAQGAKTGRFPFPVRKHAN